MRISKPFIMLAVSLALAVTKTHAVDKLPLDVFTAGSELYNMKISPSGKYVLFGTLIGDQRSMFALELDNFALKPGIPPQNSDIDTFQWADDDHILFQLAEDKKVPGAFYTMDRARWDETRVLPPINGKPGFGWIYFKTVRVRGLDPVEQLAYVTTGSDDGGLRQELLAVNYRTGAIKPFDEGKAKTYTRWLCDSKGKVRLRYELNYKDLLKDRFTQVYQRANDSDKWIPIEIPGSLEPERYVNAEKDLVCKEFRRDGSTRYVLYNFATKSTQLLDFQTPPYNDSTPENDAHFIVTGPDDNLAGVRWIDDKLKVKWFLPLYASIQQTVDSNLPDTINVISSVNDAGDRMIIRAFSDKEPGRYYLFDVKKRELRFLTQSNSEIDPKLMAPMLPIDFKAADGATIYGYLTTPLGEKKPAPLVVYIHGGPSARDEWGFDSWVQFLANRGYAVLQVNYRGSTGYGKDYELEKVADIHEKLPLDIAGGVDWAVANGYADPKRVAVVGGSFGGYAVMHLLTSQPDKYRCGIAFAGVFDWLKMVRDEEKGTIGGEYWRAFAHNPKKDRDVLKKISVIDLADKVQVPVYLIHGVDDFTVAVKQSKMMASALKDAGKSVQTLYIKKETHYFQRRESRRKLLEAWEVFLAENMK
ncbi:MAG: alpha/beta fold hydrolase [Verrucomicrobiota bacterium]|nr:alpha/beta fold hydrolase [Verrucomicrobiota bacterium]